MTEPYPLAMPTADRSAQHLADVDARVQWALANPSEPAWFSAEDVLVFLVPTEEPGTRMWLSVDEQNRLHGDFSFQVDPNSGWVNIRSVTTFSMMGGWFTSFYFDQLTISGWDCTAYIAGEDLSANMNQNMAQRRAAEPDLDRAMRLVDEVSLQSGGFSVRFNPPPGGWAAPLPEPAPPAL